MEQYTIPCTPEQTKKAFELGAPILKEKRFSPRPWMSDLINPTAEQMIGWLRAQGYTPYTHPTTKNGEEGLSAILSIQYNGYNVNVFCGYGKDYSIILAAIDAALERLSNRKK